MIRGQPNEASLAGMRRWRARKKEKVARRRLKNRAHRESLDPGHGDRHDSHILAQSDKAPGRGGDEPYRAGKERWGRPPSCLRKKL